MKSIGLIALLFFAMGMLLLIMWVAILLRSTFAPISSLLLLGSITFLVTGTAIEISRIKRMGAKKENG
jgi:hypothetical protein